MADAQTGMSGGEEIGLGGEGQRSWPRVSSQTMPAIDVLKPMSPVHDRVLRYLLKRLEYSERLMSNFHSRWRHREQQFQAYLRLEDYEKLLKSYTETGRPPQPVSIVVPYSFATINTIVTYLVHTFTGRKPMFPVGTYKEETQNSAHLMEQVLQYQVDSKRLTKYLFNFFNDGELYGLGVLIVPWKKETAKRTVWREQDKTMFGIALGKERVQVREDRTVYEGSEFFSIDPFMFFPDPRVPLYEASTRAEYIFWRTFCGFHDIRKMEQQGVYKWTANVGAQPQGYSHGTGVGQSARALIADGEPHPGEFSGSDSTFSLSRSYVQEDKCSIEIVPAELGLSPSPWPEKWIFTIANKKQIVQAEKQEHDHGKHPVVINEPYATGHSFGSPGISDYLGPVQDTVSWFINSHIHNVRSVMNNSVCL